MKDDFIHFFLTLVVPCILVLSVGLGIATTVKRKACSDYQKITGRNTKYLKCSGCYIESNDEWFSEDEYKATIIAREGLRSKN